MDRLRRFSNGDNMTDPRPEIPLEHLLAIDAPHFFCGVVLREDRVVQTAPIVRYMLAWQAQHLKRYCHERGWRVEVITINGGQP